MPAEYQKKKSSVTMSKNTGKSHLPGFGDVNAELSIMGLSPAAHIILVDKTRRQDGSNGTNGKTYFLRQKRS